MRTSRSLIFSFVFLLLSTFSAAWPWPRWLPDRDSLVVRQNNNNDNAEPSSAQQTRAPQSSGGSRTTNNAESSITDAPSSDSKTSSRGTGSVTGSNSVTTGTSRRTTATKAQTTEYDARLPAGGVAMITPSVFDGEQYYKIGDFVTFAWNYTSLEATPTAVNILATCKVNNQLYTIAMNQTVTNATQSVVWDTGNYQKTALADPLLTEKYTLIIYDAQSAITDNARSGYLAVYNQYSFGMYTPQPYVPLDQYVCVTCSGAFGDMERRMMSMVFGMGFLTVLSFTWFVGGTGVIW